MATERDEMTFTEIVGESDICCDYAELWGDCPQEPARWVAYSIGCPCGFSPTRLICTSCKDNIMVSLGAILCMACGDLVGQPARLAYSRIEPLDKKS